MITYSFTSDDETRGLNNEDRNSGVLAYRLKTFVCSSQQFCELPWDVDGVPLFFLELTPVLTERRQS